MKDETGKRYGTLLVVEKDPQVRRTNKDTYWWCQCDCGNYLSVRGTALRVGQKYCGRCRKQGPLAQVIWTKYKRHANERGVPFSATVEDFAKIIFLNCTYCGCPPSNTYKRKYKTEKYSGIDRVDNTKGYTAENCAPACGPCNILKNSRSVQQFEEWVENLGKRKRIWGSPLHEKSPYEALTGRPLSSPIPTKSRLSPLTQFFVTGPGALPGEIPPTP